MSHGQPILYFKDSGHRVARSTIAKILKEQGISRSVPVRGPACRYTMHRVE
jgi:hypothetical protein